MKVFSVIGLHHSGKTTTCENIIRYIKQQGVSVSSIKDIHQENFTMEKAGSNSQRHLLASGNCVFARGHKETYLIWNRQLSLKEMLSHLNSEWVVIEGIKDSPLPKIIAAKNQEEVESLIDDRVFAITGIFSEGKSEFMGIPCINAVNDTDTLGKLVMEKVFPVLPFSGAGYCGHCGFNCYDMTAKILKGEKTRDDCGMKKTGKITIKFNDEEVVLNEWVQTLTIDMVLALCKNLKGYKEGDGVKLEIRN